MLELELFEFVFDTTPPCTEGTAFVGEVVFNRCVCTFVADTSPRVAMTRLHTSRVDLYSLLYS